MGFVWPFPSPTDRHLLSILVDRVEVWPPITILITLELKFHLVDSARAQEQGFDVCWAVDISIVMFLKRISLDNIRSIEHLSLSFEAPETNGARSSRAKPSPRKWTLILGENGSGKSSILRSIALVLAGSESLSELLVQPDSWVRIGQESCSIEAELVTAQGEERTISLKWERDQTIRDIFSHNQEAMDQLDAALKHAARNYFTVGYGASRRLTSRRSSSTSALDVYSHSRSQSVSTLFSNDAVLNPLDTWAMDLEYRRSKGGLEIVRSTLRDLLPGVTLSRIDRENRQLLFDTPDGELPLDQLSDGYQNMAAWCGDLLYRITETYQDYRRPLSARGLLLIDEIDLHLHPSWQRVLRDFLDQKLPNFQIVATTHSPLTAQQASAGELYFLQRDSEKGSAELEAYAGSPNMLLPHQLLLSPAFNIPSIQSREVEEMKIEYRQLSRKREMSSGQKRRLHVLAEELGSVPDWNRETDLDKRQVALLEKLESALGTASSSDNGKGTG
jgi:predicted ATPase